MNPISTHSSLSPATRSQAASPPASLARLQPAGARHPAIQAMIQTRKQNSGGLTNTDALADDSDAMRMLVDGLWAHEFLLGHDAEIACFTWCPELAAGSSGTGSAGSAGSADAIACAEAVAARAEAAYTVSPKTMGRLTTRTRTHGLLSSVRLPTIRPADFPTGPGTVVLVADGVEYAGNLGALIRTVDACGADGVILSNRRAGPVHPVIFTASRGAVLTTPVLDLGPAASARDWLAERGFTCYLADPAGTSTYRSRPYPNRPIAVVVGSEGSGLSEAWYAAPHEAVAIPMRGAVDSLNVSVAAGVLLFEICAQLVRQGPNAEGPGR